MKLKTRDRKTTTVSAKITEKMREDVERILMKYKISWSEFFRQACEELIKSKGK